MKKIIIPTLTLICIILFIFITLTSNKPKTVTSKAEIDVIKKDSNLDILVNLGNYSKENYSEDKLLDVAMQYAEILNLMNESNNNDVYFQYANKKDVHALIKDLTGFSIEAPIEINDFYYLYDSENDFYYYLGTSPSYYKVSNIKNVTRIKNQYTINCTIAKTEDSEIITKDNVCIILNFLPQNPILKYQIEKITIN